MHPSEGLNDWLEAIPPAVLGALLRVPPLAPAAAKLYAMNQEDADMRDISAVIASDPPLSTLVLRLVNSPLFGVRHPVTGILQAVAMLGLERVRVLATTAAFRMLLNNAAITPALQRCWRHSVACALASQDLTKRTGFDRDAAYTAGLLHDIGRFAMLSCWPRDYSNLLANCPPAELLQRELESLGVTHTLAGAFLLQHWGLPSELVDVAREHHCPPLERHPRLVELVSCGCQLADAIGFAVAGAPDERSMDQTLASLISDQEAFCFRIADGINQLECI